ncbi:exodeoxyribonuclease 7 large subunit [Lysobacter helvus]|uniref:Exodeoxyribonuclease 7 large subunit n=2 Tax=Lysobacteraceae TaxID=32033 RepID=A0ABM7Q1U3_9GAMM|nr:MULTISPECIES: exodeoxyribonuclease VII large subunit [Lysobacter]BCT91173.1 exodeoxyribonuclease 7 large subunit [Lysobacter caseinilyticus]BCT94326.1 exodeoxyribonuclease 7 large subunit [Lysobacter helvus]
MTRDDARKILSPTQLNTLARDLLEGAFPLVWVEGELGNLSRPGSGHLYFTLKDARAQVRCALFKPKSQWLNFVPREGLRVLARGRLTLYEARGDYQLILDSLEEAGEGALRRAFEELKAKLQAEGLFEAERKRPLPAFVRRIGVLTSPSGAAVRDVLSVLARRFPLVEVDVLPVQVQGETAPAQIVAMLQRAVRSGRYDTLLLARGGGSLEDLWAFNDERLVRSIAASPIPVVSAIGHETDFSLSDFVADLRAPTPSVAAELLVPARADLRVRLQGLHRRMATLQLHHLRRDAQRADRAALRLHALRPRARLDLLLRRQAEAQRRLEAAWRKQLEHWRARMRHADAVLRTMQPRRRVALLRQRLEALRQRPRSVIARRLQHDAMHLRGLARSLEAVSPLATVARGYSILLRDDGHVVRGVNDAKVGDRVQARLADGTLPLRVIAPDD